MRMFKHNSVFLLFVLLQIHINNGHKIEVKYGIHGEKFIVTVVKGMECVLVYNKTMTRNPYRINTHCGSATKKHPILITVKQEQQVLSWQIPAIIKKSASEILLRQNSGRTICYDNDELNKVSDDYENNFFVHISTSSNTPINVSISTKEVVDYFIEQGKNYSAIVSPTEPVFYFFPYSKENEKSYFVQIESQDKVCLVVSIQSAMCPVQDLNKNIKYKGKFQTMITKGGLYIKKNDYPMGFFLVIVAKDDNESCVKNEEILEQITNNNQTANVTFLITYTIQEEEYLKPILAIFFIYFICSVIIMTFVYVSYKRKVEVADVVDNFINIQLFDKSALLEERKYASDLTIAHFIDDENVSNKRTYNFLWFILNTSLFYGIPVVQLMASYQNKINVSGNSDVCFYNFYCSRPYWKFSDFNHIYSNIGYIMFGITFICVTLFRDKFLVQKNGCGIPKHYGIYYAIGMALIMEGIMSGCYHVCPTKLNFQFDTTFMYMIATLCMIKLYQNRHPSINAGAYSTFTILGLTVFIAMLGILLNSKLLIGLFTVFYIFLCAYVSFNIYYLGDVLNVIRYYYNKYTGRSMAYKKPPFRKSIFISMLIINAFNLGVCISGILLYPKAINFGTFLLAILLGNLSIYIIFYITMKIIKGERICWEARIYILLMSIFWIFSGCFFFNAAAKWDVAPAESKLFNNDCILMDFFDQHDIWHMLSAFALMFSFLMLMCLDNDLLDKPHHKITVF